MSRFRGSLQGKGKAVTRTGNQMMTTEVRGKSIAVEVHIWKHCPIVAIPDTTPVGTEYLRITLKEVLPTGQIGRVKNIVLGATDFLFETGD